MSYLLDSDILVFYLRGHGKIRHMLEQSPVSQLHTTLISAAELWSGNRIRRTGEKQDAQLRGLLDSLKILPFCEHSVMMFAAQKSTLYHSGNIIGDFDIAIASIALAHRLTLVTNNVKDFRRIRGLKVENWAA